MSTRMAVNPSIHEGKRQTVSGLIILGGILLAAALIAGVPVLLGAVTPAYRSQPGRCGRTVRYQP